MNFKIHRGTQEIGGSCVEVWTESTRILLDFGMPLVEKEGTQFDFKKYSSLNTQGLIENGVLPDVKGLYETSDNMIDAVIISHSHQDHYGFTSFINENIMFYLGEASHKIIELNSIFTPQDINLKNTTYFQKEKAFTIGDIRITPYWTDHSAFDAYAFLVESNGKSLFYSGDFRSHGRKRNVFRWFTLNAPQNVDYLLLEGTTIGREGKPFKSEEQIEKEFSKLFKKNNKINLVYTSGQNIDRLVSIYKACNKANKTLVVDVYIAKILSELSKFAGLPYPSKSFKNLKVMYSYYTCKRLTEEKNEEILYQFKDYKITKKEINNKADDIVLLIRPSMQKDLEHLDGIDGGNLIYSMWKGYLTKRDTKRLIDYLAKRKFTMHHIHTSGHADTQTLKKMVEAIKPKQIIPIHTFNGGEYQNVFSEPVIELKDGETIYI